MSEGVGIIFIFFHQGFRMIVLYRYFRTKWLSIFSDGPLVKWMLIGQPYLLLYKSYLPYSVTLQYHPAVDRLKIRTYSSVREFKHGKSSRITLLRKPFSSSYNSGSRESQSHSHSILLEIWNGLIQFFILEYSLE